MLKLNENPVELNGKKWFFYGGVYKYGSFNGSLGILVAGPRGGHAVMITENLFNKKWQEIPPLLNKVKVVG